MADRPSAPAERVVALAAYVKARGDAQVSLGDITRDVPGYDDGSAPRDEHGELVVDTPEWETLRKKLQRDLNDLATYWGVHIEWVEGSKSYALRPAFFSPSERAACVAAAAVVEVEGLDAHRVGDLGSAVDDRYTAVVVSVPDVLRSLRDACASRTAVRFQHSGQARLLEPYALGQWANHWYVAGWSPEASAMRRYRLDRIDAANDEGSITSTGEPGSYEIPDWFDASLAFDMDPNSWGHDPALEARIEVALDRLPAFLRELGGTIATTGESDAVVELTVRHYQWTRDRLLGFRGHALPTSPPELVDLLRDHLVALSGAG